MPKYVTSVDKAWKAELRREDSLRDKYRPQPRYEPPRDTRPLDVRVSEAIAWGVPDRESVGCTPEQFTSLLAELQRENEALKSRR